MCQLMNLILHSFQAYKQIQYKPAYPPFLYKLLKGFKV